MKTMFRPASYPGVKARCLLLTCVAALIGATLAVATDPPAWWSEQGATDGAAPDDYAVANIGQLKHFAAKAAAELNAQLSGGAESAVNDLIAGWTSTDGPAAYAAVNLGQLKTVAKPFYDRLMAVSYTNRYPWTGREANIDDDAAANLGQLKYVFSFDPKVADGDGDGISNYLEVLVYHTNPHSLDTDGDGLSDGWEIQNGTKPNEMDAAANPDNDGLTNAQEFLAGSNPLKADTDDDGINDGQETITNRLLGDSDGDLMPDGWEAMIGTSPTTDNGAEDSENDGMLRALEFLVGRNPAVSDSPSDGSNRALDVYLVSPL